MPSNIDLWTAILKNLIYWDLRWACITWKHITTFMYWRDIALTNCSRGQLILNMNLEGNFEVKFWRHRWYHHHEKNNWYDLVISDVKLKLCVTLKKNRAPLLCYFKLCASFRSHWWIQTGVTVLKRLISVKINDLLSCVTLQFDVWPWNTIGHLSYATSSFVHHIVAIDEFKLELKSGNAQFGLNSTIYFSRVTF